MATGSFPALTLTLDLATVVFSLIYFALFYLVLLLLLVFLYGVKFQSIMTSFWCLHTFAWEWSLERGTCMTEEQ